MSTRRKFTFPLATLVNSADLLESAIADPDYKAPMEDRLTLEFTGAFLGKITALTGDSTAQSSQTGDIAGLTIQQRADFDEMERLAAGGRRTAKLAFSGQTTLLHAEFKVGDADSKSIAAEIDRARTIHASCVKYAAELRSKGWLPADTAALFTSIGKLGGTATGQSQAMDDRLGMTNEKVIAANDLYHDCLVIQNAARLQYPATTDASGNARNVTPRARFLLDEFPPRDRSQPDGGTQGGDPPPPAPPVV